MGLLASLRRKTGQLALVACSITYLGVIGVALLADYKARTRMDPNRLAAHTQEVDAQIDAALMSLGDAGVAARAYVLTGDESWLRAHAAALTRLDDRLKQLSGLTVDQPAQRKKLAQLETLKAELADSLNQLIESRKSHGQDSASEARLILQSIEERNKFRLILAQMEAEEYGFVSSKISASDASSRLTVLLWILGTVTALTFLAIVFHLLQREIRERKLAEMRLQAAHHET